MSANRVRNHGHLIYLNDDEEYILETKWKLSGMRSKSAYIRHLILHGYVYEVDYSELREYNTQLAKIGSNLNQIAKQVNTTGSIYKSDMEQVQKIMEDVWRTQKSMLSKQPSIKQ